MKIYYDIINKIQNKLNKNYDPRHIMGYIELTYPVLSNFSHQEWIREIKIAIGCIEYAGIEEAESCAQSFGL